MLKNSLNTINTVVKTQHAPFHLSLKSIRIVSLIYAAHRFGLKLRTLSINTETVSCDCVIKWKLILEGMLVRKVVIVPEFTELVPYNLDLKLFSFRKWLYSINSRILTLIIYSEKLVIHFLLVNTIIFNLSSLSLFSLSVFFFLYCILNLLKKKKKIIIGGKWDVEI